MGPLNDGAFEKYGNWLQWSIGPDGLFWGTGDLNVPADPGAGLNSPQHAPWGYGFDVPYDPTNGTTSFGNVIRSQSRGEGTNPYP